MFRFQAEYLTAVREVIAPTMRHAMIDGAYDKMIVRLGGGTMPLRLLSPYEGSPEETYNECRLILDSGWLG
jgi:hypothetical protein